MTTYTPGKWKQSSLAAYYVISGDGPKPICAIGEYKDNGEEDGVFDNWEANLRLICASPGLLEALKFALEVIQDQAERFHKDCRCQLCESAPEIIKQAIATAERGEG